MAIETRERKGDRRQVVVVGWMDQHRDRTARVSPIGAGRGFGSLTRMQEARELEPGSLQCNETNRHGLVVRVIMTIAPCARRYGDRLGIGTRETNNNKQ